MKSVSSLILLMGTLAYAAMQIGVHGPAATMVKMGEPERTAAPQRIVRGEAPRRERIPAHRPLVYFATAR
jgi:hypothetical protein